MNFSQLELLRYLQETDFNLSRASEKLNIVQSAASRQLQMLEDELGSPLLLRTAKKIHGFTPFGARVMDEIENIELSRQNLQKIASDYKEQRGGTLHIATTHTQAKYLLPVPISNFRQQYPHIKIYMVQSSPGEIIDLLHHHKADIAICTEKLDDDDKLVITPCYEWHHIALVPRHHPLAKKTEISLETLSEYPLLTYSPGYTGYSNIEKAFRKAGLELDITLAAADSEVIKTYVRLDLGVGIVACTCYEPNNDTDLVALDLSASIPRSRTKIAYLKNMYMPSYLQYFVNQILAGNYGPSSNK